MKFACGISVSYYLRGCVAKSSAPPFATRLLYVRVHARASSVFLFLPSPLHLFGCKALSKCELRVKSSPFCLHLFFAMDVVQCVVYQFIAVSVKVKAGFAFTLNRLIYSLLRGEVKGEGKMGNSLRARACIYA